MRFITVTKNTRRNWSVVRTKCLCDFKKSYFLILRTSWIPGTGYGTVHVIQQSAIGQIQMRNACLNQYIQYIPKELLGRKFPFSKVGIVEVDKRSKVACAGWFSFLSEVHTASVISFTLGIKKTPVSCYTVSSLWKTENVNKNLNVLFINLE